MSLAASQSPPPLWLIVVCSARFLLQPLCHSSLLEPLAYLAPTTITSDDSVQQSALPLVDVPSNLVCIRFATMPTQVFSSAKPSITVIIHTSNRTAHIIAPLTNLSFSSSILYFKNLWYTRKGYGRRKCFSFSSCSSLSSSHPPERCISSHVPPTSDPSSYELPLPPLCDYSDTFVDRLYHNISGTFPLSHSFDIDFLNYFKVMSSSFYFFLTSPHPPR